MAGPAPTTLPNQRDRSAGPVHSSGWLFRPPCDQAFNDSLQISSQRRAPVEYEQEHERCHPKPPRCYRDRTAKLIALVQRTPWVDRADHGNEDDDNDAEANLSGQFWCVLRAK